MSDEGQPVERESAGCIFGMTLGLAIFGTAIFVIAQSQSRKLESPAELWAEHFQSASAPADFEFVEAAHLTEDRQLLRLRRTGADDIAGDAEPDPDSDSEEGESEEDKPEIDWTDLEESERGTPPDELVFIFYSRESSELMLATYFQNLGHKNEEMLEDHGGGVIIESGELDWRGYRTGYVRQREYRVRAGEPEFVDSLRVNLSLGQSCVLIAIWPPSFPSGVEAIEALLADVEPLQSADS